MWLFLSILLIHWYSDFVLQTRHMATRKSDSNYYLTFHVSIYSVSTILSWFILFLISGVDFTMFELLLSFVLIFSTHWVTDYITSRQTSKYYKLQKFYEFFNVVGFDQWLHFASLFIIYNYIILN